MRDYSRYSGQHFARLDATKVELFHLHNCDQCNALLSSHNLRVDEPSNEALFAQKIVQLKFVPPVARQHTLYDDDLGGGSLYTCGPCVKAWRENFPLETRV